jgi:hypothetical protein
VDLRRYYGRPITRRLVEEVSDLLMEHILKAALGFSYGQEHLSAPENVATGSWPRETLEDSVRGRCE